MGKKFQEPGQYFKGTTYVLVYILFLINYISNIFLSLSLSLSFSLSFMFLGGEEREHCLGWNNALGP